MFLKSKHSCEQRASENKAEDLWLSEKWKSEWLLSEGLEIVLAGGYDGVKSGSDIIESTRGS